MGQVFGSEDDYKSDFDESDVADGDIDLTYIADHTYGIDLNDFDSDTGFDSEEDSDEENEQSIAMEEENMEHLARQEELERHAIKSISKINNKF